MPRLLVIDESLSTRIAADLNHRGRNARTVAGLGLKGWSDPQLLARLHEIDPDCVLVSGDDLMPAAHAAELARFRTTVAIVQPWDSTRSLPEPQWEHEIVQRWVQVMETQKSGSIFRYTLDGGRRWRVRKRPLPLP
jgi:hypothetical protein